MKLIIVESPTKAKTITKFLNKDYKIESSFGHVRDLPKSEMGVDLTDNFKPKYIIPTKAKKNLTLLKKLALKADKIILATDEDREGEAIAWHLAEAMKIDADKADRIVFHEITKDAILGALEKPRKINMELVDAQQARRILDRLVGYELSPFLWKKVAKGLSAGRVQSVAVRLIVEREREIQAFKADEFWTIDGVFNPSASSGQVDQTSLEEIIIKARLNKISGKSIDKLEIKNEEQAKGILHDLESANYSVSKVDQKETKKNPPKPFTTSTIQQTANRWFGFSAKQTMMLAQRLYEVGHITYMRTDSVNLSDKFISDAKNYLVSNLGEKYSKESRYKTKSKGAQEAHEAIRPTEASRDPESLKNSLESNQYKLYKLIWQRALASQMAEAVFDAAIIDIMDSSQVYEFRANGQVMKFDGYLKIYPETSKELDLPKVNQGDAMNLKELLKEQHFTKPPARYSDAGLVKEMEKYGIGRPSTYAPTISTIEARNYVERDDNKKLKPTDIAFVVMDLLIAHFPKIVDFEFTAKMEKDFDDIAQGKSKWQPVIEEFYSPFHENLQNKYNEINKQDIMPEETSNEVCDKCGSPMIIKTGRYGKFYACSNFPDCKNIKSINGNGGRYELSDEKKKEMEELQKKYAGEKCEKCGSDMVIKNGKFGPFLACSGYPQCKNLKNIKENDNSTGIKCPACGQGEIVQKRSKRGIFYACNKYPDCKNAYWGKPTGDKCPECGSLLVEGKDGVACSKKGCSGGN
jgi:DNA topoisomerase-1